MHLLYWSRTAAMWCGKWTPSVSWTYFKRIIFKWIFLPITCFPWAVALDCSGACSGSAMMLRAGGKMFLLRYLLDVKIFPIPFALVVTISCRYTATSQFILMLQANFNVTLYALLVSTVILHDVLAILFQNNYYEMMIYWACAIVMTTTKCLFND